MTTMTKDQVTERMVEAILTSATCGDGCWYAREKVCRCSCGGKNHGCLLEAGAARPARTSRIQGTLYELSAIGKYGDLARDAAALLKAIGPRETTIVWLQVLLAADRYRFAGVSEVRHQAATWRVARTVRRDAGNVPALEDRN